MCKISFTLRPIKLDHGTRPISHLVDEVQCKKARPRLSLLGDVLGVEGARFAVCYETSGRLVCVWGLEREHFVDFVIVTVVDPGIQVSQRSWLGIRMKRDGRQKTPKNSPP